MAKIELEKDDFLDKVLNTWSTFKDVHTTKEFCEYAIAQNLTLKELNSIKSLSKDKLKEELLKSQSDILEDSAPKKNNTNANFANDIINVLDALKMELQNKPLNGFIKMQGTKALQSLINKYQDNNNLENMGMIANGVTLIFVCTDVFVDIKTIPKKIKDFKQKKEALKNGTNKNK